MLADLSKQVPNNSYGPPVLFYVDKPFACIDCGKDEVWTARQQQWYYEVAKGSLYATAVRCRDCRRKRAELHSGKGDPNPIKHEGALIKHVQKAIGPAIADAGFVFVCKSHLLIKGSVALDYSRGELELTCWYDRPNATLIAEMLDKSGNCVQVANVPMRSPSRGEQVLDRIAELSTAVIQYLSSLAPEGYSPESNADVTKR
ncbi:MAG: zinc-ribbon domain-containing protein [Planctomycetales bacterium]